MNLIIVDDEYYTVESLRQKIEERCPDFERIFCAYNLKHAMEYFSAYEIGVMICDIEMPGGSGLELLDQIRAMGLQTSCIFLTAYAKFDYISRAMKLASSDYLLKPVEDEPLLAAIDNAAKQYRRQANARQNTLYANYWKESTLYLMEQFWQDLLSNAISQSLSGIQSELKYRKLDPTQAGQSFILLLIQCTLKEPEVFEKSLFDFALKNITREYFYNPGELSVVVRMAEGLYALPLPEDALSAGDGAGPREGWPFPNGRTPASVVLRCRQALKDFVPHFPYAFHFFVAGAACTMDEISVPYAAGAREARENVSLDSHVFDLARADERELLTQNPPFPEKHWADLILQNKNEELLMETRAYLDRLKAPGHARRESLAGFYYSFIHLLFKTLEEGHAGEAKSFLERLSVLSGDQPFTSFSEMQHFVAQALEIYQDTVSPSSNHAEVVAAVKKYIREHLYEDMTRDTLAAVVYLNTDYLSHIFKKETGNSLTNYIIDERIRRAKQLLAQRDMSIRDIAIACGFQNISYFSRQFKKSTGMTPREFRSQSGK